MMKLGLVMQVGTAKQTKGTGVVDIFQFTELGRVMAWVVENINPDRRKYAEDKVYELFQSHYKREPSSSIDMFCSIAYYKLLDRYRPISSTWWSPCCYTGF